MSELDKVSELRKLATEEEEIAIRFSHDIDADITRGYSRWQGPEPDKDREVHHNGLSCYAIYEPSDVARAMKSAGCGFGHKTEGRVRTLGEIADGCWLIAAEGLTPESS